MGLSLIYSSHVVCALRLHSSGSRQSIFFLAVLGRRLKISASRAVKVKFSHLIAAVRYDVTQSS